MEHEHAKVHHHPVVLYDNLMKINKIQLELITKRLEFGK